MTGAAEPASAAPHLLPGTSGHCGTAQAAGSCELDSKGSWALAKSEVIDWPAARSACTVRCHACRNCRFVSFSVGHRDCSWFEECEVNELRHEVPGFRTIDVKLQPPPEAPPPLVPTTSWESHATRTSRIAPVELRLLQRSLALFFILFFIILTHFFSFN